MILTNRQKKAIDEIVNSFELVKHHNAFTHDGHKLYYDAEKDLVILATHFMRTIVNLIDEDDAIRVIDKKGKIAPLSHSIKVAKDRLKYLQTLKLIKEYK